MSVKPSSERAQDVKENGVYSPPPHTSWEVREILRNKNQGKSTEMQVGLVLPIHFRDGYKSTMPCEILSALRH